MALDIKETLDFAIQQIFAESYWGNYINLKNQYGANPTTTQEANLRAEAISTLLHGNSRKAGVENGGYTKLTQTLVDEVINRYEIVSYCPNQTAGFAAILLKDKDKTPNEYTLAFRSTEYKEDFFRDAQGADQEISEKGFSYGQISEMEIYYQSLINTGVISSTQSLNISGYSLGGHLAYAFYTMHPNIVQHAYIQNGAGIGLIGADTREQTYYKEQLVLANQRFTNLRNDVITQFLGASLVATVNSTNYNLIINSLTYNPALGFLSLGLNSQSNEYLIAQQIVSRLNTNPNGYTSYGEDSNFLENFKKSFSDKIFNNLYSLTGELESNNIYNDPRYKLAVQITKVEFNTKSRGLTPVITGGYDGGDAGVVVNTLFPPTKFTTISGKATPSSEVSANDPNFVSKSNLHSEYFDLFIEDQPEVINNGGRLPGPLLPITKNNIDSGDLGNTHSLTALIDSMKVMKTLQKLDSNIGVDLVESILNGSSNQFAPHWVMSSSEKATESNSNSNVINSLYRLFINPIKADTPFSRRFNSLGEVENRNELHTLEKELEQYKANNPNSVFTIKSLYDKTKPAAQQIISSSELLTKALQNNSEGMAYRYALREMNNFVVLGVDYSGHNLNGELDLNKHSDLWYKARSEILTDNIADNIVNSGVYLGLKHEYGSIVDAVSFRKLSYAANAKYISTPFGFVVLPASPEDLGVNGIQSPGQVVKDYLVAVNHLKNLTIFDKDIPQTITTTGPPDYYSYLDTKYSDYIFMGNKNNTIALKGGTDTIETGNNNNFINASNAVNSTLNLSLYGNNTIQLGLDYKGGMIYYKNQLLTGGSFIGNGTYQDQNYTNITYKFIQNISTQLTLQIKYLNTDNTYNTTEINGFNRTVNSFGLTFNDMVQTNVNTPLMNLTDNVGNPYVNSSTITLTPPPNQTLDLSSIIFDVAMSSGSYAYFYKEGGASYKILLSDLSPGFYSSVALEAKKYDLSQLGGTVYYRPYDILVMPKNVYDFSLERSGDDLTIKMLDQGLIPSYTSVIVKNYFNFDHTLIGTGIYYKDFEGNALSQVTQSQLLTYNILSGGLGNDEINTGFHSTVEGGSLGNDIITSGTQDTVFLNRPLGGSDTFVSGSGNNKFVFSYLMNDQTIIKNIKTSDKIIFNPGAALNRTGGSGGLDIHSINDASNYFFGLGSFNMTLRASGNDLLIIRPGTQTRIKIENYFTAFTNPLLHSGIYLEDTYGVSYEINISDFETKRTTTLKLDQSVDNNLTLASSSQVKEIDMTDAKATIKAEKDDVLIKTSGGTYADIELKAIPTTAHTGAALNVIETSIGTPAVGESKDTNITVKNFSGGRDQLNVAVANTSNVIFDKSGNDLIVRELNLGETLSVVTLTDYFINNYNTANPTSSSGIAVYNTTSSTAMTVGDLGNLLSDYAINSTANNATITVGDLNRNTVITSTGSGATITGGKFNDNITAGNGDDVFVMSRGVDTYHLSSTSGIDELMFDKEKLFEGAAIIVQFDSSVALEDISFYYDKYEELFTIQVNNDNGLVISNIDENSAYSIEQFMQVKLSNGDNVFEENYTIENGGPFTYDGLPNNVILDTSANNTLTAITSKSNLIFGGAGNDTLTGNNNVIATGNTDYKANLLVGGLGNDTIAVGSYDIVMARQGDGQDVINYTTNHDDFLISLIRNAGSTEFGLKTVGNNLEIYYGNGTTDKVTVSGYWTRSHDEMNLVLTDRDSLNNTHLRGYTIAEIMSEMGMTKANTASGINYVDYSDIESILLVEESQLLVGGEVANYYAELGNFTGLSLSAVVNTFKEFDQEILLGKSGYGDISDYRKL